MTPSRPALEVSSGLDVPAPAEHQGKSARRGLLVAVEEQVALPALELVGLSGPAGWRHGRAGRVPGDPCHGLGAASRASSRDLVATSRAAWRGKLSRRCSASLSATRARMASRSGGRTTSPCLRRSSRVVDAGRADRGRTTRTGLLGAGSLPSVIHHQATTPSSPGRLRGLVVNETLLGITSASSSSSSCECCLRTA